MMRGNTRVVVLTEPLWGIPFSLYSPYVSVYMLALGVHDSQIGLIASISLLCQMVWALLSGAITDKLGRKRTTFIADLISWTIPLMIFAGSQGFVFFLVGGIIQSVWRIAHTSWSCLLVEDAPQEELVNIFTWIYIFALASAFLAPFTGVLINRYGVITTMRGLYIFAVILMTTKFFILNHFATETSRGIERMRETQGQSILSLLSEYRGVLNQLIKNPVTIYTVGILIAIGICNTIQNTFWAVLVTEKLQIPPAQISFYPFARSIVMLVIFFFVIPRFKRSNIKNPMLVGLGGFFLSQVLLINMPPGQPWLLLITVILDACSMAIFNPMIDSLLVLAVDASERARILSILYVIIIAATSPFGWIAGELSEINRTLPFVVNAGFYLLAAALVWQLTRVMKKTAIQPSSHEVISA
jgi:DHA1 family tetracycline resistance protein-like MFS transporter